MCGQLHGAAVLRAAIGAPEILLSPRLRPSGARNALIRKWNFSQAQRWHG